MPRIPLSTATVGFSLATILPAQGAFLVDSITDELYTIDPTSGDVVVVGSTNNNGLGTPVDLTWRRETQELWVIDIDGDLGRLNTTTAAFSLEHSLGSTGWLAVAWHECDHCFYLSNADDQIYRFVPETATLTALGNSGQPFIASLDTDGEKLYGVDLATGELVIVDRVNGSALNVGTTVTNSMVGLAIEPYSGTWRLLDAAALRVRVFNPLTNSLSSGWSLGAGPTSPRGLEFAERRCGGIAVGGSGMARIDEQAGHSYGVASFTGIGNVSASCYVPTTGELWVVDGFTGEVGVVDQTTGVCTIRTTTSYGFFPITDWNAMTWDPTTGTLLLLRLGQAIWSFDPTLTLNNVAPMGGYGGPDPLTDFDVDAAGNVYGIEASGPFGVNRRVVEFRLGSAASNVIAKLPSTTTITGGGIGVDRRTNAIYVIHDFRLQRVDRAGTVTPIGNHAMMTSPELDFLDHAPAYVVDSASETIGALDLRTGAATAMANTLNGGLTGPSDLAYREATNELWVIDEDGGEVGRIDPTTGIFTRVFQTGVNFCRSLVWDESTFSFYFTDAVNLYRLRPKTGATTVVGPTGYFNIRSLDSDPAGNLIGIDFSVGAVVRLDRTTGAATLLGTTTTGMQGLAIDGISGEWYSVKSSGDSLYTIDPASAAATLVGGFGPGFPIVQGIEVCESYGSTLALALAFGAGCGGMSATTQTQPRVGERWEVTINAPQQATLGFVLVGLQEQVFPLDPLGAPGCTAYVNGAATFVQTPFPTPAYAIDTPATPAFVGLPLFVQGLALVPGANALGFVASNGIAGRIGW